MLSVTSEGYVQSCLLPQIFLPFVQSWQNGFNSGPFTDAPKLKTVINRAVELQNDACCPDTHMLNCSFVLHLMMHCVLFFISTLHFFILSGCFCLQITHYSLRIPSVWYELIKRCWLCKQPIKSCLIINLLFFFIYIYIYNI